MVADLSVRHEPVSTLFDRLGAGQACDQWRLSDEQVHFFQENGYLTGVRILTDEQVDALREELADLLNANHEGQQLWYEYHSNEADDPETVLFHALGAWRIKAGFHDLLWNPAFTVPASQLLGGSVRFWHDQLFCKPAKHGGVVAWHQDYSYWTRTTPMAHLTCWIALDDSREDNGCLRYVPGSHRWDLLPITGLAGDMDAIRGVLDDQQYSAFTHPAMVELRAGEASFHHPLMVHGSRENRTDRPRRATVLNVFQDGVCSASDEALLAGVPPIQSGCPMKGQFFPLLRDASATGQ